MRMTCRWARDTLVFASGGADGIVHVWSVVSGKRIHSFDVHAPAHAVHINPRNRCPLR